MKNMFRAVLAGIFLAFIISCGGGGSSTTQTVTPPPPPPPPPPGTTFPNDTSKTQSLPIKLGTTGGNSTDSTTNTANNTITCCSGTLGSLVSKGGNFFILSNNHVLDKSDQGKPGDPITQPGLVDNQCKGGALVATMSQAAPLTTSNVDAAIAQIVPGTVDTSGNILDLGAANSSTLTIAPAPPSSVLATPAIGMNVAKAGRSTGLTCSSIGSVNTNVKVDYSTQCGNGGTTFTVTFSNQVVINGGNFSASGDSGSLVVTTDTARPVALLFAGNTTSTTANPLADVIAALGPFTIVGGGDHAVSCVTTATVNSATQNGPSAATLTASEMQRAGVVRDKYAGQLMQDRSITSVEAGASADNPKESAVVIHVNGVPGTSIPQLLDGVRTRIVSSARQNSITVAADDVERTTGVKDSHAGSLMAQEGILGVGVGASADSPGEPALVIYVEAGKQHAAIPAVIDGVRTKVVEGDRFRTFNWGKETKAPVSCPKPKAVSVRRSALKIW